MSRGRLLAVLVVFLIAVGAMWTTILVNGWGPVLGLDLRGGVSLTLIPTEGQEIDEEVLEQTVEVIRERIDSLGVAEPDIARQGDTVLVQLPGVADEEQAREVVGQTAVLQFRRVFDIAVPGDPRYDEVGPSCGELDERRLAGPPDPTAQLVLCEPIEDPATGENRPTDEWVKYVVGPEEIPGSAITNARAQLDSFGTSWVANLSLDSRGARQFEQVTADLACNPPGDPQRQFAVVLDGRVFSAPQMSEGVQCNVGIVGGDAVITTGGQEDAENLAVVLRAGALPIQLEVEQSQQVSASLGEASLDAGLLAGFIGLLLVAVYLIALYRGIGVAAIAELAMFGVLVYGAIIILGQTVGFTLTLAGIAGIIVSIGIAADSSIIYRERYRDEIRAGRTPRTAADHAFSKAFATNLTGNTVSFIAAVVLYSLAIGPVRGFAFTLGLATLIDTILFGTFTRSLFGFIARSPKLAKSPLMGLRADVVAPVVVAATSDEAEAEAVRTASPTGGS